MHILNLGIVMSLNGGALILGSDFYTNARALVVVLVRGSPEVGIVLLEGKG